MVNTPAPKLPSKNARYLYAGHGFGYAEAIFFSLIFDLNAGAGRIARAQLADRDPGITQGCLSLAN